ncbi:hypothetical protein [Bacillus sp. 3255]|uniref:hypothetical protein n=1 Tax=Bacillus sp. 3255 TaxID=2817904 RepID=UPI0028645D36|nr:hypothetical protein [Bacillus sp. 3255]MDR6881153.1 hypothetical protein [Bacillus sp. 3255]
MRMRFHMLLIAMVICAALLPDRAFALSCAAPRSIEESYAYYDAVVVANVDEVHERRSGKELKLTVLASFKGLEERNITAMEDLTWGTSRRGTQYLFFLKKKDADWEHPLCSPTKMTADAARELEYLKEREIPIPDDAKQGTADGNTPMNGAVVPIVAACLLGALLYGGVRFIKRK